MSYLIFSNSFTIYFFFSFCFLLYLFLKAESSNVRGLPVNLWVYFLLVNFFFMFFSLSSTQFVPSANTGDFSINNALTKTFVLVSLLIFLIFFFFLKETSLNRFLLNSRYISTIFCFFFFTLVVFASNSILDSFIILEFISMTLLLFLVSTFSLPTLSKWSLKRNIGFNVRFNSFSQLLNAILNFFFLMFILGILFFSFFLLHFYYYLGTFSTSALADLSFYYSFELFFSGFFFFILFVKLAGAPLHLWKFEVFNNLSYIQIAFYSFIYFFFFFAVLAVLSWKISLFSTSGSTLVVYVIVIFNLLFIIFNTAAVLEVKHFLILSTLVNSTLLILSIFFFREFDFNFFLVFFLNYILASSVLFTFFIFYGNFRYISEIRTSGSYFIDFFLFIYPLVSLGGVAPSLGFFFKFFLFSNVWVHNYFFLFSLGAFSIIYTTIFYFQIFKNFFLGSRFIFKTEGTLQVSLKRNETFFWLSFLVVSTLLMIFGLFFFEVFIFWFSPVSLLASSF